MRVPNFKPLRTRSLQSCSKRLFWASAGMSLAFFVGMFLFYLTIDTETVTLVYPGWETGDTVLNVQSLNVHDFGADGSVDDTFSAYSPIWQYLLGATRTDDIAVAELKFGSFLDPSECDKITFHTDTVTDYSEGFTVQYFELDHTTQEVRFGVSAENNFLEVRKIWDLGPGMWMSFQSGFGGQLTQTDAATGETMTYAQGNRQNSQQSPRKSSSWPASDSSDDAIFDVSVRWMGMLAYLSLSIPTADLLAIYNPLCPGLELITEISKVKPPFTGMTAADIRADSEFNLLRTHGTGCNNETLDVSMNRDALQKADDYVQKLCRSAFAQLVADKKVISYQEKEQSNGFLAAMSLAVAPSTSLWGMLSVIGMFTMTYLVGKDKAVVHVAKAEKESEPDDNGLQRAETKTEEGDGAADGAENVEGLCAAFL